MDLQSLLDLTVALFYHSDLSEKVPIVVPFKLLHKHDLLVLRSSFYQLHRMRRVGFSGGEKHKCLSTSGEGTTDEN